MIFQKKIERQIEQWVEDGLLEGAQAARLRENISGSPGGGLSFGNIIAILAAILLCASIISFVAANWQEMSDLARVGLLFAGLWAAYGSGALLYGRSHEGIYHGLLLIGITMFGTSMVLISQIFHLQGDAKNLVLIWAIGAFLTAYVTHSVPALIAVIPLMIAWLMYSDRPPLLFEYLLFPVAWLVVVMFAKSLGSSLALHLLAFTLLGWQMRITEKPYTWIELPGGAMMSIPTKQLAISTALLIIALSLRHLSDNESSKLYRNVLFYAFASVGISLYFSAGSSDATQPFIAALIGVFTCGAAAFILRHTSAEWLNRDRWVAILSPLVVLLVIILLQILPAQGTGAGVIEALLLFAFAIWMVRCALRLEIRGMAVAGFLYFVASLFYTYSRLFGSLEQTALVYLIMGVALLVVSVWVLRHEVGKKGGW